MCGCGIADWCAGGCSCGCDHDTLEGQRSQAQHFARNYKDMTERAIDAFQRGKQRTISDAVAAVEALARRRGGSDGSPAQMLYDNEVLDAIEGAADARHA